MSRRFVPLVLLLASLSAACGKTDDAGTPEVAAATATATAAALVADGPIDDALADRGEQLFQAKACSGCHTFGGGRLTGPDLAGVTTRREAGWIAAMIQRPDSMLKTDPLARQLLMQYATPMPNLSLSHDEVAALYEYLRRAGG